MAYTPELSQKESALVRRIAWALGVPDNIQKKVKKLIELDLLEIVDSFYKKYMK